MQNTPEPLTPVRVPSAETAAALRDHAVAQLRSGRDVSRAFLATLDDRQFFARVHGIGNHAAWIVGHIAFIDDAMLSAATGSASRLPAHFEKLFGTGSSISDQPADYPSRVELTATFEDTRRRLLDWVGSLHERTIFTPMPENYRNFIADYSKVSTAVAQHEFMHLGQITVIRASLGMKPVFA